MIRALIKHGIEPVRSHDLSRLRILASTGEPWDPESWRWLFENVGGGRLPIINITGGTEVGACLLSAFPITPLKPCSLVGPSLGMAVDVYDPDGRPLPTGRRRAGLHQALAGDDAGDLGRPRALPGDLLVAMAGRLGPRRLGLDRRGRRLVPPRPQRRHDQGGGQATGAGRGRVDPHGPRRRGRIGRDRHPAQRQGRGHPLLRRHPARPCARRRPPAPSCATASPRRLGKSFAPEGVRFVAELPKTRSGKILRRVIQRVATGQDPGDLSTIENLGAIEAIRGAE